MATPSFPAPFAWSLGRVGPPRPEVLTPGTGAPAGALKLRFWVAAGTSAYRTDVLTSSSPVSRFFMFCTGAVVQGDPPSGVLGSATQSPQVVAWEVSSVVYPS